MGIEGFVDFSLGEVFLFDSGVLAGFRGSLFWFGVFYCLRLGFSFRDIGV